MSFLEYHMQPQTGIKESANKKLEIMRCARELFSAKGFKDTSVSDITKLARMAAGTFYLYFSSKDKLFMEIYMEENVKLKKEIMETFNLDDEPMKVMRDMIRLNYEGMTANPILREWYNREIFAKIEKNYREENGLDHVDFLYTSFIEVVRKWQAEGKMRSDIDSEMIMALFSAIINVDTHKEEIGFQYFPAIMGYLSEFVMKGLMDRSNQPVPPKHD
jgi:AcrR family transcriptional regulator